MSNIAHEAFLLLQHGANPDLFFQGEEGSIFTPRTYAQLFNAKAFVELFEKYDALRRSQDALTDK